MRTGPTHIHALLRAHHTTAALMDRRRRDEGLLGEIRARLPAGTRPHCVQAAKKGAVLTLTMDSSAWATRVRYLEGDLIAAFAPAGVTAIKIRVSPPGRAAVRAMGARSSATRTLAPTVVNHLLDAADHIADPGLAEALRRLARRHAPGRGI